MSVEIRYEHIQIGDDRVPLIAGTTMKVVEIVEEQIAYGWSAEELHLQHPYLSLGQIHSALAYYWDNREEMDREIERRVRYSEQMRQSASPSPLVTRLKAEGLL